MIARYIWKVTMLRVCLSSIVAAAFRCCVIWVERVRKQAASALQLSHQPSLQLHQHTSSEMAEKYVLGQTSLCYPESVVKD